MSDSLLLSLCCNHYRNGAFRGVCAAVNLDCPDGVYLHLESPWIDRSLKCDFAVRTFGLGAARWWPHHGLTFWHGNFCWDSVRIDVATAADVLNFLRVKGYRPDSGTVDLWDLYEAETRVEPAALQALWRQQREGTK